MSPGVERWCVQQQLARRDSDPRCLEPGPMPRVYFPLAFQCLYLRVCELTVREDAVNSL